MAHDDFLAAFAAEHGVGTMADLLGEHSKRYAFQINSRERARKAIAILEEKIGIDWQGKRILDVGCAYGAFTIELANRGAQAVGIELSAKWLRLAKVNAENEVAVPFIHCDAACPQARQQLSPYGPFEIVIVNDVFEHIYDTAALLQNIKSLMSPGGVLYFKVPNGMATRHVLLEGHKGKFGISILAPDYWTKFVKAPFHIYYRRWEYFRALFNDAGFVGMQIFNANTDPSIETTKKHILRDVHKIKQHLKLANFENTDQLRTVRVACQHYFEEVAGDMETMSWDDLFFKYRVTFWEGVLHAPK